MTAMTPYVGMAIMRGFLMIVVVALWSLTAAEPKVLAADEAHRVLPSVAAPHHDGGCDTCDHDADLSCFSACAAWVFLAADAVTPQRPEAAATPGVVALARLTSRAPPPEPTPPRQRA